VQPNTAWEALGAKLKTAARKADATLHGHGEAALPKQTIIHGDPKAANFFFRASAASADAVVVGGGGGVEAVGIIDFQWMGLGVCATDVAYCVLASAAVQPLFASAQDYTTFSASVAAGDMSALDRNDIDDSEEHIVKHYYGQLVAARARDNNAAGAVAGVAMISYETFLEQYQAAFIDQCRMVIAVHWSAGGTVLCVFLC
jgi:thiamine kinase-like enzyme